MGARDDARRSPSAARGGRARGASGAAARARRRDVGAAPAPAGVTRAACSAPTIPRSWPSQDAVEVAFGGRRPGAGRRARRRASCATRILRDRLRSGDRGRGRGRRRASSAAGSHQPVGDVTEITGVGTLPAARRRGIGSALTARLARDAREPGADARLPLRGATTASRGSTSGVGFRRVGTAVLRAGGVTRAVAVAAAPGSRLRSAPVLALLGALHDRVLGDPRAPGGRAPGDGGGLPLRCTRCPCSAALAWREERRYGPRAAGAAAARADRRALLRRRPDLLAPGDRRRRRGARDGARQPPGRDRAVRGVGGARRGAGAADPRGAAADADRRRADLGRAGGRRVRREPGARRDLRRAHRGRPTRASSCCCATGRRTSGGRPGRCSTPRGSRRSRR